MDADGRLVLKSLAVLAFATVLCCAPVRSDSSTEKIFESASAALRKGDYAAAEVGFRKVLQAEPRNIGAMSNLGVVYSRTLRYARAIGVAILPFSMRNNPSRVRPVCCKVCGFTPRMYQKWVTSSPRSTPAIN